MGVSIREKPKGSGVWWLFVWHQGQRKSKRVGNRKTAEEAAEQIKARLVLGDFGLQKPEEKPEALFRDYAKQWLDGYVAASLKGSTQRKYEIVFNRHLKPVFGTSPINAITREEVKRFLFRKMNDGLSPVTVKCVKAILSGIFTQAIEDGHVQSNPASRMGRMFKAKDQNLGKEISPLTAVELDLYLETCQKHFPEFYPLFLTLARTGMRLGETLGLQWSDIDFAGNFIEVKRGWVEGRVTTPKSGKVRRVDMTPHLSETLQKLRAEAKRDSLKKGKAPQWVFTSQSGTPVDHANLRQRIHFRICEKAGLRQVRIHDLRHSYATIRITAGHNIADVSKQLGHASITITVDLYYHWMPSERRAEVAELDVIGKATSPK